MPVALVVAMLAALISADVAAADNLPSLTRPIPPLLAPADPTLPIELDAAFSELDRRNNRLIFRQLNITQGSLAISADEATADPADFENSVWIFTGNVRINNAGTQASSDSAELTFRANRLRRAALRGQPAKFSQAGTPGNPPTEGRAQLLDYDLDSATIQLTNDAFLSDGRNEISGSRIAYDLQREVVTAGGNPGGEVRMRITPQQKPSSPASKP
jgi:lipopolysaccharide export system protein LptA